MSELKKANLNLTKSASFQGVVSFRAKQHRCEFVHDERWNYSIDHISKFFYLRDIQEKLFVEVREPLGVEKIWLIVVCITFESRSQLDWLFCVGAHVGLNVHDEADESLFIHHFLKIGYMLKNDNPSGIICHN